jgi:sugar-specific transcriptional regulator TrmB
MQVKSPLPKQTMDIYSLLLEKGALNAEQIGKELKIFPHAVYRAIDQLKFFGCVNQQKKYPAVFMAQPVSESVETFALLQREWFLNAFIASQSKTGSASGKEPTISFIESREQMFEKMLPDLNSVKEELNLLISGDEAPAEIMLAQKNIVDRGGTVRTLVQKRNKENEHFLQARKKMGEHVRVHTLVNARLMLFDRKIAYVMSYDPNNFIKSTGIRFEYAPLAQLMTMVFLQYWEKGIAV